MIYRGNHRPVPIGFREAFLAGGWKAVEKRYGASNAVIMQWKAACGGINLDAERRAVQRTGRKAGGNVGVRSDVLA